MKNVLFISQLVERVSIKHKKGYVYVRVKGHPYAHNNILLEHRHVVEQSIGRYLLPSEQVHHRNGDKADNRLENLELCQNDEDHKKYHVSFVDKELFADIYVKNSILETSRILRIGTRRVKRLANELGLKPKIDFEYLKSRNKKICSMYLDGHSLRDISKKENLSHVMVWNILIENNIKLRNNSPIN